MTLLETNSSIWAPGRTTHVRPLAVQAMEEIGVDISGQESKTLDRYLDQPFDYVITVCDDANKPARSRGPEQVALVGFEDPSEAEAQMRSAWRSSADRDGIKDRCKRN